MNTRITTNAITKEINPLWIASLPSVGPTTNSPTIFAGAGSLPALRMFERYQSKVGGFLIEDDKWIVYKADSKYFEVSSNGVLFQNTLDKQDANDYGTRQYLDQLVYRLNKLTTNINADVEFADGKKIVYVLIWANLLDPSEDSIVGL